MTKHPTFDRVLFAFTILSAWFLPTICIWAFAFESAQPLWYNTIGLICSAFMLFIAYFLTFALGGLRYVLTGNETK